MKILSVTCDNASTNETFLRSLAKSCKDEGIQFHHQKNHVRFTFLYFPLHGTFLLPFHEHFYYSNTNDPSPNREDRLLGDRIQVGCRLSGIESGIILRGSDPCRLQVEDRDPNRSFGTLEKVLHVVAKDEKLVELTKLIEPKPKKFQRIRKLVNTTKEKAHVFKEKVQEKFHAYILQKNK